MVDGVVETRRLAGQCQKDLSTPRRRRADGAGQASERLTSGPRVPMPTTTRPNERWNVDFVSARTVDGRWFRTLTVLDLCTLKRLHSSPTDTEAQEIWTPGVRTTIWSAH